jgi:hypothetical protein
MDTKTNFAWYLPSVGMPKSIPLNTIVTHVAIKQKLKKINIIRKL